MHDIKHSDRIHSKSSFNSPTPPTITEYTDMRSGSQSFIDHHLDLPPQALTTPVINSLHIPTISHSSQIRKYDNKSVSDVIAVPDGMNINIKSMSLTRSQNEGHKSRNKHQASPNSYLSSTVNSSGQKSPYEIQLGVNRRIIKNKASRDTDQVSVSTEPTSGDSDEDALDNDDMDNDDMDNENSSSSGTEESSEDTEPIQVMVIQKHKLLNNKMNKTHDIGTTNSTYPHGQEQEMVHSHLREESLVELERI